MTAVAWRMALVPTPPRGAEAVAAARDIDDGTAWFVAAWRGDGAPEGACRVDPAALDPAGPEAVVSLTLVEPGRRPLFDDAAVVAAVRHAARLPAVTALSTLTADPVGFAGALVATRPAIADGWPEWWGLDPFRCFGARRRLRVDRGLVSARPAVVGPGTQRRYGAPWPARG